MVVFAERIPVDYVVRTVVHVLFVKSCCNGCWGGGEYGCGFSIAIFSAAAALFSCPVTID
jgi:hypothetical protein